MTTTPAAPKAHPQQPASAGFLGPAGVGRREVRLSDMVILNKAAVYLTPLGRKCRWLPAEVDAPARSTATFVYDTRHGRPGKGSMADGFVLSRENWHILQVVR